MHPLKSIEQANNEGRPAYIVGPMVRYSKLAFRNVCRDYNADIVYTPMILAREFCRNQNARLSDYATTSKDVPVIVQFGANNSLDLIRACHLIKPYCSGIGLNCGCPIKEQVAEGIGAALMTKPELVAQMVHDVKAEFGPDFFVDVKMRIHKDLNDTIAFAKMVEAAGADIISVHGRLKNQRSSTEPNYQAIRMVKESVSVPVIANGNAFTLQDVQHIAQETGVNGVMAVRGALANPAMFSGYEKTPWHCIERFLDHVTVTGLPFRLIQHHLSEMLDGVISRAEKKDMNSCATFVALLDWLDSKYVLKRPFDKGFATEVMPCPLPV